MAEIPRGAEDLPPYTVTIGGRLIDVNVSLRLPRDPRKFTQCQEHLAAGRAAELQDAFLAEGCAPPSSIEPQDIHCELSCAGLGWLGKRPCELTITQYGSDGQELLRASLA